MMHRSNHAPVSSRLRPLLPAFDRLEARELLSSTPGLSQVTVRSNATLASALMSHPTFPVSPSAFGAPPPGAFTPAQIQQAYGFNAIAFGISPGDGAGQTIAIIDAYDDPNIQADLNAFD